jgi:hypothetical protein
VRDCVVASSHAAAPAGERMHSVGGEAAACRRLACVTRSAPDPLGHWKPVVLPNAVSFLRAWCASGCSFRRKKFLVSLLSLSSMTPVPHHQIAELPTVIKREKLSSMLIGITMVMFGAPLKA